MKKNFYDTIYYKLTQSLVDAYPELLTASDLCARVLDNTKAKNLNLYIKAMIKANAIEVAIVEKLENGRSKYYYKAKSAAILMGEAWYNKSRVGTSKDISKIPDQETLRLAIQACKQNPLYTFGKGGLK